MKRIELFQFEQGDPPWSKRLDEAFNCMVEFSEELTQKTEEARAFNRILSGQFEAKDVELLSNYTEVVRSRAVSKYNKPPLLTRHGLMRLGKMREGWLKSLKNFFLV